MNKSDKRAALEEASLLNASRLYAAFIKAVTPDEKLDPELDAPVDETPPKDA
ncbi:MAG TPA: hypothetical protein VKB53_06570 [Gammaproteobacteria bacterium]|jgi:hypothetical protein|nr:hypothetical protein [Gammaproteobacteria bacterium]HKH20535.1 hypothetical protein [Gammaproteobacteria bacterium]